jgi:endonuclease YncB( thermonuclease family)
MLAGLGRSATMRIFVATILALTWSYAWAADYEGSAVIVDGDTIELHVGDKIIPVRLCGIDSPEARHAGGPEASAKMASLIAGKEVQCVQVGDGTPCDGRSKPTSHKRIVAQCFVDGVDISKVMVCSGHAVDWPKFSGGYYQCERQ